MEQQVDTLLVGTGGLLHVVEGVVGVSQSIVSQSHSEGIAALLGVGIQLLGLFESDGQLTVIDVGVGGKAPVAVVVSPLLGVTHEFKVFFLVFVDGVVVVVVVEPGDALVECLGSPLVVFLPAALIQQFVKVGILRVGVLYALAYLEYLSQCDDAVFALLGGKSLMQRVYHPCFCKGSSHQYGQENYDTVLAHASHVIYIYGCKYTKKL